MPIYTKKGDRGKTSLKTGEKVWKDDVRISAYGSIDEVNSCLGLARSCIGRKNYEKYLTSIILQIQDDLMFLGSALSDSQNKKVEIDLNIRSEEFEKLIDEMTKKMPPLSNFILPGGGEAASRFHVARTVVRRAERQVVKLEKKQKIDSSILVYMNRLSDLLFTMARFANYSEKKKDIIWIYQKKNNRKI